MNFRAFTRRCYWSYYFLALVLISSNLLTARGLAICCEVPLFSTHVLYSVLLLLRIKLNQNPSVKDSGSTLFTLNSSSISVVTSSDFASRFEVTSHLPPFSRAPPLLLFFVRGFFKFLLWSFVWRPVFFAVDVQELIFLVSVFKTWQCFVHFLLCYFSNSSQCWYDLQIWPRHNTTSPEVSNQA